MRVSARASVRVRARVRARFRARFRARVLQAPVQQGSHAVPPSSPQSCDSLAHCLPLERDSAGPPSPRSTHRMSGRRRPLSDFLHSHHRRCTSPHQRQLLARPPLHAMVDTTPRVHVSSGASDGKVGCSQLARRGPHLHSHLCSRLPPTAHRHAPIGRRRLQVTSRKTLRTTQTR